MLFLLCKHYSRVLIGRSMVATLFPWLPAGLGFKPNNRQFIGLIIGINCVWKAIDELTD